MPTVVFRADKSDLESLQPEYYQNADFAEIPPKNNSIYYPISVGAYIGLFLLLLLPGVNLILLIIWASGRSKRIALQNMSRAILILLFFAAIMLLIFWFLYGNFWSGFFRPFLYYI